MESAIAKRIPYLLLGIALLLTACKSVTVNVPMDNVKLADGYYNSSTVGLGDMWVWDTKSGSISLIYTFTKKELAAPNTGDRYDEKRSSISADTNLEVSGNQAALNALSKAAGSTGGSTQGEVGAKLGFEVANLSNVTIKNFRRIVWGDSLGLLNKENLRWLRNQWASTYPDDYWKFVFVYKVIKGQDISISAKRTANFNASANAYTYGDYTAKVTYGREYTQDLTASTGAALIVDMHVFRLDPSAIFKPDPTQLNFQTVAHKIH